jgi:hypothetical protein
MNDPYARQPAYQQRHRPVSLDGWGGDTGIEFPASCYGSLELMQYFAKAWPAPATVDALALCIDVLAELGRS